MDTGFPELDELRVTVGDQTRDEQWSAIVQEIRDAPAQSPAPWRRRIAVWVAAAFSVGLPVAAVAAENTVPGDLLYPVKLVVEPVRSLFDSDVAAVHRVEELERISESDAPATDVDRAFDRAERAADDAASPELVQRVERVRDQIRERRASDEPATDATVAPERGDSETDSTPVDPSAGTDSRSTTTTAGDESQSGDTREGSEGSGSPTTGVRDGSTSTSTSAHSDQTDDSRGSDGG
jgi:hypothetical protein